MKPEAEQKWLFERIYNVFHDVKRPTEIDSYNSRVHKKSEYIKFLEKNETWQEVDIKEIFNLEILMGESFLRRLTDQAFIYYTPVVLIGCLDVKNYWASGELIYNLAPLETQDLPATPSEENKEDYHHRINLFSPQQKTVIADIFDYQSRIALYWHARQAFEGYWHQFATRQPEI